jgi:hypothetical protein
MRKITSTFSFYSFPVPEIKIAPDIVVQPKRIAQLVSTFIKFKPSQTVVSRMEAKPKLNQKTIATPIPIEIQINPIIFFAFSITFLFLDINVKIRYFSF